MKTPLFRFPLQHFICDTHSLWGKLTFDWVNRFIKMQLVNSHPFYLQHLLLLALRPSADCWLLHPTNHHSHKHKYTHMHVETIIGCNRRFCCHLSCLQSSIALILDFLFLLTVVVGSEKLSCQQMRHSDRCYCTSALTNSHPPACENTQKRCCLLLCLSCTNACLRSDGCLLKWTDFSN